MLSFRKFLEAYFGTFRQPQYHYAPEMEIHKNPSRVDLARIQHKSDFKSARGLLHFADNGEHNAYFWDANKGLHHDALEHLENSGVSGGRFVHVETQNHPQTKTPVVKPTEAWTTEEDIRSHTWANKTLAHHKYQA